ncbi:MAG: Ig-like domain-containing protein [Armatimonas sp.]
MQGPLLVGEATLVRPAGGGVTSANFDRIPVGPTDVIAMAYPGTDASGIPQAQGTVAITVVANQVTPVSLTMTSTINQVALTPGTLALPTGQTTNLTATAYDNQGRVVLHSPGRLQWASSVSTVATVDGAGRLTTIAAGVATIQVTDTESGKSGTATVTVSTGGGTTTGGGSTGGGGGGTGNAGNFTLSLTTNDIVYDPTRQKIWVSLPSANGANGNSIQSIDIATGALGSAVFVGSEPSQLAMSSNCHYLYVALRGSGQVRRVNLDTMTPDLLFSLPNALQVEDIAAQPDNENVVAISLMNVGFSPRHEGVVIYDNGVARAQTAAGGGNVIEFGTSTRLYGYGNEISDFQFVRMTVDNTGLQVNDRLNGMTSGYNKDIRYQGGRLYTTGGEVYDPETRQKLGVVNAQGAICADNVLGRIWVLVDGSPDAIKAFDSNTFVPVATLNLASVEAPTRLIRVGAQGLAFRSVGKVTVVGQAP